MVFQICFPSGNSRLSGGQVFPEVQREKMIRETFLSYLWPGSNLDGRQIILEDNHCFLHNPFKSVCLSFSTAQQAATVETFEMKSLRPDVCSGKGQAMKRKSRQLKVTRNMHLHPEAVVLGIRIGVLKVCLIIFRLWNAKGKLMVSWKLLPKARKDTLLFLLTAPDVVKNRMGSTQPTGF